MKREIWSIFTTIQTLLSYILESGNDKIFHILFCNLKQFEKKIEDIYFREVLLENLKLNIISIVVITTILHNEIK